MSAVDARPLSPFKGLAAFEDSELDALFFFGRERERQVLLANLLAARLTVLYGESGVGKSSLIGAALVRDLREATEAPIVVRSSWSHDGVAILEEFEAGAEGYLVLDQFEEYFLYHDADTSPLLLELPELLATTRVNVLLSLREDALARLDVFKARIPGVFGNQVRLEHLAPEQATAAILGPLERWRELYEERVDAEPELVDAVIAEVAVDGGRVEAPYLQLVVERVWEAERAAGSNVLRRATLDGLGGAAAIVDEQFRGALESLQPGDQDVAAAIFEHLVTPTGGKIALSAADLAEYAHVGAGDARQVLDRLTRERVVRAVEGSDRYEIFHDVLAEPISAWRLERRLVSERAASRRRQKQLLAVAVSSLLALAVVAALAVWAFSERGTARTQARRAHAHELEARALQLLPVDANKSVRLALSALWLEPSTAADSVLRQSLVADRLRLVRHEGAPVHDAAVSPDGSVVAVAVGPRQIQLVAASNRRLLRTIATHRLATAVGFSPDGKQVIATGPSHRPEVFALASGAGIPVQANRRAVRRPDGGLALVPATRELAAALEHSRRAVTAGGVVALTFRDADGRVRAEWFRDGRLVRVVPRVGIDDVALDAGGTRLATASANGLTTVWDTHSGRVIRDFEDAKSGVAAVAFSPDGTLLATGGEDAGVRIWDLQHGTRTYLLPGLTPVTRVAWSPDGGVVASSAVDGTVLLWRIHGAGAGSLAATLSGEHGTLGALSFSADGSRLVTGGRDGILRIWDARPDEQLRVVGRGPGPALAAAWTAGGSAGLWPHVAKAFDGSHTRTLPLRRGRYTALAATPQSNVVALGTSGGATIGWDGRAGKTVAVSHGRSPVTAVAVDPSSGRVAGGAKNGTVTAVGSRTMRQRGPVTAMAFSADGRTLLTGGSDGATLWDAKTGARLHFFPAKGGVTSAALSPDGKLAAVAGRDGLGRLWFVRTGNLYRVLRGHHGALTSIVFSADGKTVATSGNDADARIWNVDKGTHYALQRRSFGPLAAISLDPTGHWAAGAAPISVILWDAVTGRWLSYLRGHTDHVNSVAFAPVGETVLTSSADGTVRTYVCRVCAGRNALIRQAEVRLAQTR